MFWACVCSIAVSLTLCTPCRVWDIKTGQMVNDLRHHKGDVNSLKFNSELLITGSDVSGYRILSSN